MCSDFLDLFLLTLNFVANPLPLRDSRNISTLIILIYSRYTVKFKVSIYMFHTLSLSLLIVPSPFFRRPSFEHDTGTKSHNLTTRPKVEWIPLVNRRVRSSSYLLADDDISVCQVVPLVCTVYESNIQVYCDNYLTLDFLSERKRRRKGYTF